MKLKIVGASNFVNRMFEACGNYQWARELLKNALEADATRVEFGIEWQAVEKQGVYRRTVIDNGSGMDRDELHRFFSTLGEGGKKIGGVHDNFGVGAKIASLPWNPEGLVVISYKNGRASMIQIVLDPESGDYELVDFVTPAGTSSVIDPTTIDWSQQDPNEIDWSAIRPDWVTDHGTVVVMLGSEEQPDTVLGNPLSGERDIKGLSVYLNTRFWDLSGIDVKVVELRSEKKNQWPQSHDDREDARRPNNRTIKGARYYLTDVPGQEGRLQSQGVVPLDQGRVTAEWYLWEGERPNIHSYAKKPGYVAVRYNGELFELTSHKAHFRWFGVVEGAVQHNLTIILEPMHYGKASGRWGVHPDQSRNRLIFTGDGNRGVVIPLVDWGMEFAENMPTEIREAINRARGDLAGSIEDEEYRKRLQDKFGARWTIRARVRAAQSGEGAPATSTDEEVEVLDQDPPKTKERARSRRRKSMRVLLPKVSADGAETGVEREVPVDVPRFRYATKDEFEKPWHLALWSPNDLDGPTVLINGESPILEEVIKYHQEQYPDVFAEEVAKIVRQVFGEVAACKIAHSQKLVKQISEQELDGSYRNEMALTVALMGLLAEESLIAQRLGRLGRKKTEAA